MSHNCEEAHIAALLGEEPPRLYLDIGANHPELSSNTWHFYQRGWRGLAVEPNPDFPELWRQMRPKDAYAACAVGKRPGFGRLLDKPGYRGECSCMERAEDGPIPIYTMDELLERWWPGGPIAFASVDVEGWEREVLAGWNLWRWRPDLILLEAIVPMTSFPNYQLWEGMLLAAGYQLVDVDPANRYYMPCPRS